ncbi:uncharacterized protein LOC113508699 [Trichoplusia ni]|uniref:Uncharacterized protein LOC113508699 n=1 Tax=Trichoplusia ni TaxID=7111 RepID=A0A7E5X4K9_TRINI|nr:uncharacterized protein LOC113508699 [Trichoplusia ni]
MLHTLLKCVNQRILNNQNACIKREVLFKGNVRHNFLLEVKIISAHYKKLLNCSRHLSACFNIQHHRTHEDVFKIIFIISYTLVYLLVVVFSGQTLCNEYANVNRSLVYLYNILIINPLSVEAKCVKDLKLLVKANPIQIDCNSKVVLGTYLLPAIMALSTTSVIVILQFYHFI